MKPTLFLDVDGVLSPLPAISGAWNDWQRVDCGFHCYLSRQLGEAIGELDVEIVWLSTWEELANEVICPFFGWLPKKVICREPYNERPWWKLNAVLDFLSETPDPYMWVDDDLSPTRSYIKKSLLVVPHLLVSPKSLVGITKRHLKEMREFVAGLQDA